MPAFDVTTKPVSLNLKPGSTGSIMVVVSNKLGRPVMGLVQGTLTPSSVAGWLVPPAPQDAQSRYEADPAATKNLEFKVVVPEKAADQDVQFKATAWDVLAPDDTKAEGQTVAIKVTGEPKPPPNGGGIKWWVWVIAAVVVIGAGVGIWLALRPKGFPDVVGKTPEKALEVLKKAKYELITVKDTLVEDADTNEVLAQEPKPKTEIDDSLKATTPVTIVVNRAATVVPAIVNRPLALALERLREAGLKVPLDPGGRHTFNQALDDHIAQVTPEELDTVPLGSGVRLVIYFFSPTEPEPCRNVRGCVLAPKDDWVLEVEKTREALRRQPGVAPAEP